MIGICPKCGNHEQELEARHAKAAKSGELTVKLVCAAGHVAGTATGLAAAIRRDYPRGKAP